MKRRKRNPGGSDALMSMVLLGIVGFGGYWAWQHRSRLTGTIGSTCRNPTPPIGYNGPALRYNENRCGWLDAYGRLVYLADGRPY